MPIREYDCERCDHVQERLEAMNDPEPPPACDKCGGEMKRIEISVGSFRIYGAGVFKPNER